MAGKIIAFGTYRGPLLTLSRCSLQAVLKQFFVFDSPPELGIASRSRRLRLRDWHPDKNPDNIEASRLIQVAGPAPLSAYRVTLAVSCSKPTDAQVAKEVFQFLQKGKTIINV